nr:putative ribonuclease H-like domain-containing protein [Tanacetum cinerariifolium]
MPPKPDLVFNIAPTAIKTDHPAFNVQLSPTKPEQDLSHTNRSIAPIIEDWVSNSENESETKAPQIVPSFVQSSEQVKTPRHFVQHVKTSIPAATPKPASPKSASSGKRRIRKACFVCKSADHLIKDYDYHAKKMAQPTTRNHTHRGNHKQYAQMPHHNPQKHMVTQLRHVKPIVTKTHSPIRRYITRSPSLKTSNLPPIVTAVKTPVVSAAQGNPQHALKDKGVIDSGCSRHMTGNMSYLSDFEELNGGYVAFGAGIWGRERVESVSEMENGLCMVRSDMVLKDLDLEPKVDAMMMDLLEKVLEKSSASESSAKKKGRIVALTTEDMQKRRNDVKSRTTLLLALPDEHQLRFSKYKTAQELWGAILKTFGGNEATKKTKNNQLKQKYGNFKAKGSETLEQTFNRLQAIRNRNDLDTLSLDDVYNHLKVYEPEVQKKSESNSQNMAFISSANTSSGKGKINTACIPTASTQVSPDSANVAVKKTGKKITIQGTDVAGFDKSKVECFNCHKMGYFARECRAPRSQDRGRRENYKQGSKVEESAPKALMAIYEVGYDWSYMANEEENHTLVANDEALTKFALMAKSSSSFENEEVIDLIRTRRVLDTLLFSPPSQVYSPPKKDMSWTGLPEFADDTITDYSRPSPSIESLNSNSVSVIFKKYQYIDTQGRLKDFKLKDETNVLLRTPKQHNMYSTNLNNIVLHKDLTCLVAKASTDKSMLWHKRLGHLNYKTMNKLVRHNLVKGLPSKCFENDHICVACLKGKQHKASYKTKLVNSVSKPLHTLYMDLFGPTSVSSLNHKCYFLVVTDDFSRFTWTFFLKTKDETSSILRNFITENLKDLKVKIIKCDNGGEFTIKEMHEFCNRKGIKREFSNARTPQQNGVAERRNKTLIEAARTMLADAKLPVTFWAEAVNTACYVQNRVLVNTSQNKNACNADAPESSGNSNPTATSKNPSADQMETLTVESAIPTISLPVPTACLDDSPKPSSATRLISRSVTSQDEIPSLDNISTLSNRFEDILEILKNKKDERGIVVRNKARLVAQGHTQEEGIDYEEVFAPVAWIEAIRLFLAYASFMGFTIYQMNVKSAFLYGTIDEEVYVMQPPGFQDPEFPDRAYKIEKAMYGLHQAPRACGNSNPTATSKNPLADQMETLAVKTVISTVSSPVPTACLDDSPEPSSDTRLILKRVTSQDDTPSQDNILNLLN